jgi:hypothetical protein
VFVNINDYSTRITRLLTIIYYCHLLLVDLPVADAIMVALRYSRVWTSLESQDTNEKIKVFSKENSDNEAPQTISK